VLRAPCREPIGIHGIGQLPQRLVSLLSISQALQQVDRILPAVLLLTWHGDQQAPLSAQRHYGTSVRG